MPVTHTADRKCVALYMSADACNAHQSVEMRVNDSPGWTSTARHQISVDTVMTD